MKYEYKFIQIPSMLSVDRGDPFIRREETLNSFGEEGWRLVNRDNTEYIFMREIEEVDYESTYEG
jgi:hypothetical protein